MRKSLGIMLGMILSIFVINAGNKIYTTDVNMLPENSRQFLSNHFGDIKIAHISIEKNWMGIKEYDIILTDGTEVEFDKAGEWKDVTCTDKPVPQAIVITPIGNYVKDNFLNMYIEGIEKSNRKYEVKLNTGLELEFDLQGRFKRIDD